jgi:hypothetical protein
VHPAVEKYATIGFVGGTGGCLFSAALHGNQLFMPVLIGGVIGTLTGAAYGLLRARLAR